MSSPGPPVPLTAKASRPNPDQRTPVDFRSGGSEIVKVPVNGLTLLGELTIPPKAQGLVIFVHVANDQPRWSGGRLLAKQLNAAGLGTLLLDLLTPKESAFDAHTGYWRFDIELLTHRAIEITRWVQQQPKTGHLALGYLAMETAAAAALIAAARLKPAIQGIVCRSGRPDFAGDVLPRVEAPTLLIVAERDPGIAAINRTAFDQLPCVKELTVVAGASHRMTEPEALDRLAALAGAWFRRHLVPRTQL